MDTNDKENLLTQQQSQADDKRLYPSVIMIDDDVDDYYLLSSVLKKNHPDYTVIPIYDSSEALSQLEALQVLPAFLLLDLNMPLKNGFDVLEEVRSNGRYTALPIVVFTSSSNPSDIVRCQALGATDYVEKPTTYQALEEIIERAWQSWLKPLV